MYRGVITILLFCVLPFKYATYLPSIFWDTANPILQEQFWQEVVQVKLFDTITFICPNDIIRMRGSETTSMIDGLYHNLYVKEVPANITSFDGVCDTSEYSTAKFIVNCNKPKEFNYQNIEINVNQADPAIPKFKYGLDYMFFATSDGTQKSLNTTSKNCTMVFRIHFDRNYVQGPSCPLFGRRKVCEKPSKSKTKECEDIIPQKLNVQTNTANKVTVTWKQNSNPSCNITYYTVCYRERLTEPCKEALVPAKQQHVTLCELAADKKYIIQVRAHTAKGPGDYSKAKSFYTSSLFDTGGPTEPAISVQKDDQNTSIDGKSIGIGFVIGVILTVILGIAFWLFITRIYRGKFKVNNEKEDENTSRNNPNFYKGDESMDAVLTLNNGYRESGQNWKLPPVQEENLHLYVSDA